MLNEHIELICKRRAQLKKVIHTDTHTHTYTHTYTHIHTHTHTHTHTDTHTQVIHRVVEECFKFIDELTDKVL
jgi:hypothetical protein